MNIGDKVKISGTKDTGVITEVFAERSTTFGTTSKVQLVKVLLDSTGKEMEYVINELRKIE